MQLRTAKILVQDTCCHEQPAPCDAGEFFFAYDTNPNNNNNSNNNTCVLTHQGLVEVLVQLGPVPQHEEDEAVGGDTLVPGQLHDDLQGGHELGGSASQVAVPLNPAHAKPSEEHSSATLPVPLPLPVPVLVKVAQPQAQAQAQPKDQQAQALSQTQTRAATAEEIQREARAMGSHRAAAV
jgi:hypothetical protein